MVFSKQTHWCLPAPCCFSVIHFLLLAWMDTYFIPATKHFYFTLVKVGLLESVWSDLDWQGRKTTISDLQNIKMLQQCILLDSLSCQILKTQSPGRVYKGTLSTEKAWRKEVLQRHAHAHQCLLTYTHAHTQRCTMIPSLRQLILSTLPPNRTP